MKTIFIFCILIFCALLNVSAQTKPQEFPIGLTVSGSNKAAGVEASYTLGKCGINDVVYVIFNNTNTYPVTITWHDGVFTTNLKWIKKEDATKTITIPANTIIKGDCSQGNVSTVALSTFGIKPKQLKRYGALNFTVTINK